MPTGCRRKSRRWGRRTPGACRGRRRCRSPRTWTGWTLGWTWCGDLLLGMRRLADGEVPSLSAVRPARDRGVRGAPRLDVLVRRRLVDGLRQQGYGGHLHVVRRQGAAVAADVLPGRGDQPERGLVEVAAQPAPYETGPFRKRGERGVRLVPERPGV